MKPLFPVPYPYFTEAEIRVNDCKIAEMTHVHLLIDVEEYFEHSTKKERKELTKYLLE